MQARLEDGGRTKLRGGASSGHVPPRSRSPSPDVADLVAKSIDEKPDSTRRDELLRQVKELNKALSVSEDAVRTAT